MNRSLIPQDNYVPKIKDAIELDAFRIIERDRKEWDAKYPDTKAPNTDYAIRYGVMSAHYEILFNRYNQLLTSIKDHENEPDY